MEALEGNRIAPGARFTIPGHLTGATTATLESFQQTVSHLNALIDAYDANPNP